MDVVFGILFLTLGNIDIRFIEEDFTWKTYITDEALSTTKHIQIIDWKEFAKVVLIQTKRFL